MGVLILMKKCTFILLIVVMASCSNNNTQDSLFKYIEFNDIKNVEKLIKQDVNLNCKKNGKFPLTYTASKGHFDIVKLLFANGARINPSSAGRPPLEGAMMAHNIKIMNYLIANGANVNYSTKYGSSLLMKASKWGNPNVVKLLLKSGARINEKDEKNASALYYVVNRIFSSSLNCFTSKYKKQYDVDYLATMKLLIEAGADVNNVRYAHSRGETILSIACLSRKLQPVEILLDAGVNVNHRDTINRGKTALDHAKRIKFKECIKLLRKHGAKTAAELDEEKSVP